MLTHSILATVEAGRLQKAVEGLVKRAYQVTVTLQDDYRVSGTVTNGDGKPYAVTIGMDDFIACNCPDAVYRKGICKHAVVLALHVICTPQGEGKEDIRPVNLKLGKVRPHWSPVLR